MVDFSVIKELRLFISTSSNVSIDDLLNTSDANYHLLPVSLSIEKMLKANLTDTNGNQIVEGKNYTVYLLSVFKNNSFKPLLSNSVSLKTE